MSATTVRFVRGHPSEQRAAVGAQNPRAGSGRLEPPRRHRVPAAAARGRGPARRRPCSRNWCRQRREPARAACKREHLQVGREVGIDGGGAAVGNRRRASGASAWSSPSSAPEAAPVRLEVHGHRPRHGAARLVAGVVDAEPVAHRRVGAGRRPGHGVEVRGVGQRQQRVQRRPLDGLSEAIERRGRRDRDRRRCAPVPARDAPGEDAGQLDRFGDLHRHAAAGQALSPARRSPGSRRAPWPATASRRPPDASAAPGGRPRRARRALRLPHRREPAAVGGGEIQRVGGAVHHDPARRARGRGEVGDDGGVETVERPGGSSGSSWSTNHSPMPAPKASCRSGTVISAESAGAGAGGRTPVASRRSTSAAAPCRPASARARSSRPPMRLNQRRLTDGQRRQRRREHAAPFERQQQRRKLHQPVRRHQHAGQVGGGRRGEGAGHDHQLLEARQHAPTARRRRPARRARRRRTRPPIDVAQHPRRIGRKAALEGPFPESLLLRTGQPVAAGGAGRRPGHAAASRGRRDGGPAVRCGVQPALARDTVAYSARKRSSRGPGSAIQAPVAKLCWAAGSAWTRSKNITSRPLSPVKSCRTKAAGRATDSPTSCSHSAVRCPAAPTCTRALRTAMAGA